MKAILSILFASALITVLAGCGEQPQTITAKAGQSAAKIDDKPYGPGTQFADRRTWELQLRARADNQNEYKRVN